MLTEALPVCKYADGPQLNALPHGGIEPGSVAANELLAAHRPDFYSAAAEVINAQTDAFLADVQTRPPFGLVVSGENDADEHVVTELLSWDDFRQAMLWTGVNGVRDFLAHAEHNETQREQINKLAKLTALFHGLARSAETNEPIPSYESVEDLLIDGQSMGMAYMAGALQSIHDVVKEHLPGTTAEQTSAIALASVRLVTRPAATGLGIVSYVLNAIDIDPKRTLADDPEGAWTRPNPELLSLTHEDSRVDYSLPFKEHIDPYLRMKIGEMQAQLAIIGCPALVFINGGSAIKKQWQWAVDVAYRAGLFN